MSRLRVIVEHPLNAQRVDVESEATIHEVLELNGVSVEVHARVPDGMTFASIVCSGSIETNIEPRVARDASMGTQGHDIIFASRFLSRSALAPEIKAGVDHAFARIESVLEQVGEGIRWRFNTPGQDSVFGDTALLVSVDDQWIEMDTLPRIEFGENSAELTQAGVREIARVLHGGAALPLAHQLLREAWNLHWTSLRSSLVIGVTAAEVGMKQHIARLLPDTQLLLEEMPAPPIDKLMARFLPALPIRADVDPSRRCPTTLRRVIKGALEDRNRVAHRGIPPSVPLHSTLESIREFLYLLDFYEGHEWARSHLSGITLVELGLANG